MGGLVIIIGVILMVVIHEGAHFVAAKAFDMKATEAFFGFGPRLWSVRRGETEYGVKALPLGGYVRIIGMNPFEEVEAADEERTYRVKPFWQKSVVVLAGITSHFLVAFVLFLVVAVSWGTSTLPDPVLNQTVSAVSQVTVPDPLPPAYTWAAQPGDVVVAVGGTDVADVAGFDFSSPEEVTLTVDRSDGEASVRAEQFYFRVDDEVVAIDGIPPGALEPGLVLPGVVTLDVVRESGSDDQKRFLVLSSVVPQLWRGDDTVVAINDVPLLEVGPAVDDVAGDLTKVTVERAGRQIDFYTTQRVVPAPAFFAGARPGDRIVAVAGEEVSSWDAFTDAARALPGEATTVTVERDGTEITFDVVLARRIILEDGVEEEVGFFGVQPGDEVGLIGGVAGAARNVVFSTGVAAEGLADLVTNFGNILTATVTGDDSTLAESRPISVIGLVQIAGGLQQSLVLLAFVNVFVGLLNVVPLYPLDGGHFAVALYEKVRGRPADVRRLLPVAAAVFIFVLALGLLGVYLDIFNPLEIPGQ